MYITIAVPEDMAKKVQATAEFLEITPEILARAALEAYVKTWEEIVQAERRRIFSEGRKR